MGSSDYQKQSVMKQSRDIYASVNVAALIFSVIITSM